MKPELIEPTTVSGLRSALLKHYEETARDLPWRRDTDPYRVLVSEFMLQQTRVETVIRYYEPWLERFPTIEALAEADEDQVLKAWEGLGYYRRARNLHKTARIVAERYGGAIPSDPRSLRSLPGVGEYTTGAMASIAFGTPAPAVDGNVRRVFARLFDEADPTPAWTRSVATALASDDRPGAWTQALMELGATVCTPRAPSCDPCPVSEWCGARAAGTVDARPAAAGKRAVPSRVIPLAVFHTGNAVLVRKRPPEGLLGGMWAFPELPELNDEGATPEGVSIHELARDLGFEGVGPPVRLPDVEHRFTHLRARYVPTALEVLGPAGVVPARQDDLRWVGPGGLGDTALPVAQRRVFESWLEHRE